MQKAQIKEVSGKITKRADEAGEWHVELAQLDNSFEKEARTLTAS